MTQPQPFLHMSHKHAIAILVMLFLFCNGALANSSVSLKLSGTWKYQKGDLKEWSQPGFEDSSWDTIKIPGDLVDKLGDHGTQIAWLRGVYTIDRSFDETQALVLGPVGDIDEVFIDGEKIGLTGSREPLRPAFHLKRAYLLPPTALTKGKHHIAIRITKWGGPGFGVVYEPFIGSYDQAFRKASLYSAIRTDAPFALGIFLIFLSSYLFLIYSNSKVERQYWYCAGMCLFVGLYCLADSWKAGDLGFDSAFVYKMEGPIIAFCAHWTLRFGRAASRKAISWIDRSSYIFAWVFTGASFFAKDNTDININLTVWSVYVTVVFIYVGKLFYHNLKVSRSLTSKVLFYSFVFLTVCVIHDIYLTLAAPLDIYWVCYGFFNFCIGLTLFLAQDYSGALADQSETKRLEKVSQELERAITKDPLTGLYTRESFFAALEKEISRARSEGSALCLAVMDLDHFKYYNDNYGHPAGDKLLSTFGWILSQRTRETEICGRLGGEEFGIILRGTALPDAFRMCDRLRTNVETFLFENPGKNGNTTVSIGLASFSGTYSNVEQLYTEADKQLYEAKKHRNYIEPHIYIFNPAQKAPMPRQKYA